MSETTTKTAETVRAIARSFIERATALNYRGKKADDAALDYFCGAIKTAELSGDMALCQALGRNAVMIVSVRGYIGVSQIANGSM